MGRTELLDLAVDAHGGLRRWAEITRFRVAASITGTIWAMTRDFVAAEVQPWHEDGQVSRNLRVTYPDSFLAHCRQQTYYFHDAALLRRIDYAIDIADA